MPLMLEHKGFFITFEGPDGSGKSSQINPLASWVRQKGFNVLTTREPGGTDIGEQIRAVIHDLRNIKMKPEAELLLFQAARRQLVEEVILPHLANGGIAISDRYADSTIAYQGYGRGIDLAKLRPIIQFATKGLVPDLTILLNLDPESGLGRRSKSDEWTRLDAESLEFHNKVSAGYMKMANEDPQRWMVVEAGRGIEVIQAEIQSIVFNRLQAVSLLGML